ncbi:MAG: porphobilinogen synthase [Bdellovibrionales bacterium]
MKNKHFNSLRPRRNRRTQAIRDMLAESQLSPSQFVYPVFIEKGENKRHNLTQLPGQKRVSLDVLLKEIPQYLDLGVTSLALFPRIDDELKNNQASEALNEKGFLPSAVRKLKKEFPELVVITDVALDPYSSDGHDGLVIDGKVHNDKTVELLAQMACLHAHCGADYVAPSDMMDGRVGQIRRQLENQGFSETGIISYTAKYASNFYGPFRSALDSAPRSGDKKTYQMDYRNSREANRELALDLHEGADMVMVKPALSYLDIIQKFHQKSNVPVAAYNVSGEYALVKLMAEKGLAKEEDLVQEILYSIRRAGADVIFTYHAIEAARLLKRS